MHHSKVMFPGVPGGQDNIFRSGLSARVISRKPEKFDYHVPHENTPLLPAPRGRPALPHVPDVRRSSPFCVASGKLASTIVIAASLVFRDFLYGLKDCFLCFSGQSP